MVDFLDAHQSTISRIRLQGLVLTDGSWRQPLPFERFYDVYEHELYNIELLATSEICLAIHAILHDYRPVRFKNYIGDPPVYRLDFRFAHAVLEGKVELRSSERTDPDE
jgi:hypothetical protein